MREREPNAETYVLTCRCIDVRPHHYVYMCFLGGECVSGLRNITTAAWDAMITSRKRGAAASPYSVSAMLGHAVQSVQSVQSVSLSIYL